MIWGKRNEGFRAGGTYPHFTQQGSGGFPVRIKGWRNKTAPGCCAQSYQLLLETVPASFIHKSVRTYPGPRYVRHLCNRCAQTSIWGRGMPTPRRCCLCSKNSTLSNSVLSLVTCKASSKHPGPHCIEGLACASHVPGLWLGWPISGFWRMVLRAGLELGD